MAFPFLAAPLVRLFPNSRRDNVNRFFVSSIQKIIQQREEQPPEQVKLMHRDDGSAFHMTLIWQIKSQPFFLIMKCRFLNFCIKINEGSTVQMLSKKRTVVRETYHCLNLNFEFENWPLRVVTEHFGHQGAQSLTVCVLEHLPNVTYISKCLFFNLHIFYLPFLAFLPPILTLSVLAPFMLRTSNSQALPFYNIQILYLGAMRDEKL